MQASLQHFATIAADKYDVPPKAIRPVGTIHLTLGVMNLSTEERIEAASAFLRSLDLASMLRGAAQAPRAPVSPAEAMDVEQAAEVTTPTPSLGNNPAAQVHHPNEPVCNVPLEPLMVNLTGLQSMHNPSKTSILYTSPDDPTLRLWKFCEALRQEFISADFLLPDNRSLLLHATIVNTLYAKGGRNRSKNFGHGKNNRGVGKINASMLLGEFGGHEWAKDIRLEKVCICQMGAKKEIVDDVVVNEEYTEVASINLP